MQLTFRGHVLYEELVGQEDGGRDPFSKSMNWTLREVVSHSPIDEDRFYREVMKATTANYSDLRRNISLLLSKGLVEL
jgi:hypothetical protein